ncbi:ComEA family DNA-binding protein [Streptosporangiaceae bacterium NEAU-GS5]|nr:ComEA family DNA-binding protein [Streptosporangiaceae bacterium NEAU-GS5]
MIPLPAGSRVIDAVTAAGGVLKGVKPDGLNLARRLIDGEQIIVGAPPGLAMPLGAATLQPSGADALAGGVVNLNAATPDQLEQLPGVGEVLARRIVEFRDTHGGFRAIDQLRAVQGIGDRKYAELKDKVTI